MNKINILFSLRFIFIILNILLACKYVSSDKNHNDACDSSNFQSLGCSVFPLHIDNSQPFACPYGVRRIECVFSLNQNEFNNEFKNLLDTLNELDKCCWSILTFENVYEIVTEAFSDVNLRKINFGGQLNGDYLIFQNAYKVGSMAFEMLNIPEEDAESLYIVFNGLAKFDGDVPTESLQLQNDSFQYLNCKELQFSNMYSDKFLNLNTKMFHNSFIQQLIIKQSNFTGFIFDDSTIDDSYGYLKSLVFENCFLNAKFNKFLIGFFQGLSNLYVINSGIEIIETSLFDNYANNTDNKIKQLVFVNNLITQFDLLDNTYLSELEYLNLDMNPLVTFGKATFSVFSQNLKKLSLQSTNVAFFENFYPIMPIVEEIILRNNDYVNLSDISHIMKNTPNLKYFDLSNTNMIEKILLLDLLELIDGEMVKTQEGLMFADFSSTNNEDGIIEDKEFFIRISKYNKNMYLSSLLTNTFVRVNQNHPCNCAIFYLYRNILRYRIPIEINSDHNLIDNIDEYLHSYKSTSADWLSVILLLPKCLRNLPLENILNYYDLNCGKLITSTETTTTKSLTEIDSTTNQVISTDVETTTKIKTTTVIISTTANDEEIAEIEKLINLSDALPFMLALISLIILALAFFTVKYKRDHKRIFVKSCEDATQSFEQPNTTDSVLESSTETTSPSTEAVMMETFWSSFKFHPKKKFNKLSFKRKF